MNRPSALLACLVMVAAAASASAEEFTLRIEDELLRPPVDARTEARLAAWDSPMGRLSYELQRQQASLLRGGQPGGSIGFGVRLKIQTGLGLGLVASVVDTGIDLYERTIARVHWPWKPADEPEMSIEQQISILLGQRLARGARDQPAEE